LKDQEESIEWQFVDHGQLHRWMRVVCLFLFAFSLEDRDTVMILTSVKELQLHRVLEELLPSSLFICEDWRAHLNTPPLSSCFIFVSCDYMAVDVKKVFWLISDQHWRQKSRVLGSNSTMVLP
jgi:hypothetical protein